MGFDFIFTTHHREEVSEEMARLRKECPASVDAPEDPDFVQQLTQQRPRALKATSPNAKARNSPRKKPATSYHDWDVSDVEEADAVPKRPTKSSSMVSPRRKQVQLAPLNALSLTRPVLSNLFAPEDVKMTDRRRINLQKLPRRQVAPKSVAGRRALQLFEGDEPTVSSSISAQPEVALDLAGGTLEVEVEESIWCGSDENSESEDELPSPRKLLRIPSKPKQIQPGTDALNSAVGDTLLRYLDGPIILDSDSVSDCSKPSVKSKKGVDDQLRPASSSDKENNAAFIRFSPPRLHSPPKQRSPERPVTPPQSPSKSRLQSPSKTKARVPTPPIRQSLDAFWDVDMINDWHDQYSPQKVLKSPRKLKFLQDNASTSPTSSPRKCQSQFKRTKAEVEVKKDFAARKHRLAEYFLSELDRTVTQGRVQELSESTGGVRLVWSKTLNSTAGRANWRRETTKTRQLDGTTTTTHKHHASIDIAEKVIDDENRLLNVIAHEFCHLANFMISGIKDQPHGKQFKDWGRKCTQAFANRGVEVTTKHSYQIEYKYIWQCSNEICGVEFKRHSKSIDLKRHTCGSCRSKLVQIKPVPRKDAGNATGYAAFVKAHFAELKRGLPGASQKEVMEAVGRKYRADKAARELSSNTPAAAKLTTADVDKAARAFEVITLDDD